MIPNDKVDSDFKNCYDEFYGRYNHTAPKFDKCCAKVRLEGVEARYKQCTHKRGHGPHEAYCKKHDPDAMRSKTESKWERFSKQKAKERDQMEFAQDCVRAIKLIASGAENPQDVAGNVLTKYGRSY